MVKLLAAGKTSWIFKYLANIPEQKHFTFNLLISYTAQCILSLYTLGKSAHIYSMVFNVNMQPNSQVQQQRECSLSWKRSAPRFAAAEQMHSQLLQRNAQHWKKQEKSSYRNHLYICFSFGNWNLRQVWCKILYCSCSNLGNGQN